MQRSFHKLLCEYHHSSFTPPLLFWFSFQCANIVDQVPALGDGEVLIEGGHLAFDAVTDRQEDRAVALRLHHRRGQIRRFVGEEGSDRSISLGSRAVTHLTVDLKEFLATRDRGIVLFGGILRNTEERRVGKECRSRWS